MFEGWGKDCSLGGLIFILLEEGKVRDEGGVSMKRWCPLEPKDITGGLCGIPGKSQACANAHNRVIAQT